MDLMKNVRTQKILIAVLAILLVVVSGALATKFFLQPSRRPVPQPNHQARLNTNTSTEQPTNENTNEATDSNTNTTIGPSLSINDLGLPTNYQPVVKDGIVVFSGKSTTEDLEVWVNTINGTGDPVGRCYPNCSTSSKPGATWTISIPSYVFLNGDNHINLAFDLASAKNRYGSADLEFNLNIPELETISVDWLTPPQTEPVEKVSSYIGTTIKKISEIASDPGSNEPSYIFVGTVTSGKYSGDKIFRIDNACTLGCVSVDALAVADSRQHKFHILKRYSNSWDDPESPLTKISDADDYTTIADLESPAVIKLKKDGYALTKMMTATGLADQKNAKKIGEAADGTIIYQYSDNRPAIRLKNGELIKYDMSIPFYNTRIPSITWSDGTTGGNDYTQETQSGCGGTAWMVKPDNFDVSSLILAGQTSTNENVYFLKDHSDTKVLYDAWLTWMSSDKTTYEQFLAKKPIFYWKDPFGRWVEWETTTAIPQAECGKPVVYLYPTQTEAVSVKLGNNITVTKSEPIYQNGWNVTAEPNGTLTTADGKTFPYLYWDGKGASYDPQTTGFVVARNNVEATFKEKLARLGLNEKEIADFNEFWLPIVTKSPYALISFVPQAEWSKAAPLSISPAPNTVIRVFMDWKPLAEPIDVAPQILPPTPTRAGFTAVEWGGLLYR